MLKPFMHVLIALLISASFSSIVIAKETIFASQNININKTWQFKRLNSDGTHVDWQNVNLPHTPKIEPKIVNNQWQGTSYYQKKLIVKPHWKNKEIFVRFEGAMNHAEVWLNDVKIGEHLGGYLPFTLKLTENINFSGSNTLSVKLKNIDNPIIGPKPLKLLDFNTYGGLYRDVNLLIKNKLHISDELHANKVAGGGVFVTFPEVNNKKSQVKINTHVVNSYSQNKAFTVKQKLFFDAALVAEISETVKSLSSNTGKQYKQSLFVKNPNLWSPENPNLYHLYTEIYLDGQLVDKRINRIGIREFSFNKQHELLINGEKTFLRGVNRHQEYPHVGYATSAEADFRDAYKIKSAGFDYVRLSHYPHSTAFMDAADELGLVLIDAILGWQYYLEDEKFKQQIINTCHDLIRRDRNHASVLAWECSLNESNMPESFIADLHQVVKSEYPDAYSAGWQHGYDFYLQARQHRQKHYEKPTQPYNVSEYGDWEYYAQNAGLNQDAWGDLKEEERTSRQLLNSGEIRLLQQATNVQEAHNDNLTTPAFADGYWVMFDYNRGYADDIESSGIMSIYRLPKYSYYFFKSQRNPQYNSNLFDGGPMVHIASEWNKNSAKTIRVFSNADEVELALNGKKIARNKPSKNKIATHLNHPPFEFSVKKFVPGQLTAKAYIAGELVAEHQVTTAGIPTHIKLSLDISGKAPAENVKDVVFAYAQLTDKKGNLVPINGDEINFTSTGDIKIIHSAVNETSQGKSAVLIQIGKSLNGASIQAYSPAFDIKSELLLIKEYKQK